jgi:Mg-chelatase subunit ChlD
MKSTRSSSVTRSNSIQRINSSNSTAGLCYNMENTGKCDRSHCIFTHRVICKNGSSCTFQPNCKYLHLKNSTPLTQTTNHTNIQSRGSINQRDIYTHTPNVMALVRNHSQFNLSILNQIKPIDIKVDYIRVPTIDPPKGKDYIFLVDSSGSMGENEKWDECKKALKSACQEIEAANPRNRISIIMFSNQAQKTSNYHETPKKVIDLVKSLELVGGGTDFDNAFEGALECLKKLTNKRVVMIFMTDGQAEYPDSGIKKIKEHIKEKNIDFEFHTIGIECESDILKKIANELNGQTFFQVKKDQLVDTYNNIIKITASFEVNNKFNKF